MELVHIVKYLVHHYVPTWFAIRQNSVCTEGSKNVFRSIELLRGLPREIQDTIRPVISRNGYWAHPEQLLLAMVADEDRESRTEAIRHIRAARQRGKQEQEVRSFSLPTINFDAQRYVDLIDWAAEDVTEPPLLRGLSDSELGEISAASLRIPAYPVHTQAVERAVRDVTEASSRWSARRRGTAESRRPSNIGRSSQCSIPNGTCRHRHAAGTVAPIRAQ